MFVCNRVCMLACSYGEELHESCVCAHNFDPIPHNFEGNPHNFDVKLCGKCVRVYTVSRFACNLQPTFQPAFQPTMRISSAAYPVHLVLDTQVLPSIVTAHARGPSMLICGIEKEALDRGGSIVVGKPQIHDFARVSINAAVDDELPRVKLMVAIEMPETVDPGDSIVAAKDDPGCTTCNTLWIEDYACSSNMVLANMYTEVAEIDADCSVALVA